MYVEIFISITSQFHICIYVWAIKILLFDGSKEKNTVLIYPLTKLY
jgi:hypothetical protein